MLGRRKGLARGIYYKLHEDYRFAEKAISKNGRLAYAAISSEAGRLALKTRW